MNIKYSHMKKSRTAEKSAKHNQELLYEIMKKVGIPKDKASELSLKDGRNTSRKSF